VATEGAYTAEYMLASLQGGGTFKVKIGDFESDTLTALKTNSALTTKAVSTVMNLAAGEQIMRFTSLSQPSFNIDQFKFSAVALPTGLQSIDKTGFTLYQDQEMDLNYSWKNGGQIQWIRLYSISGALVYARNYPEESGKISVIGIPEGIYLFQALTEKGRMNMKIPLKR
jgi:hypothetical protein